MRSKPAVLGLGLIKMSLVLSALIVSRCRGYVTTDGKDSVPSLPFSCTSFAVYSDETFYGMNFDYPDTEIRFTIIPSGDLKVFQMEFLEEGGFVPTVGMNSAGLFGSCQMLFPEALAATSPGANGIYPWQLYQESLLNLDSVKEVSEFISDKKVVHWSVTLHDLFADVHGDAMVVEAGDEANVITRIEDDFIVMTNFPNGDFSGQSYRDVEGVGADRYKIAYENISDHIAAFDMGRGLETLEKAVLSGEFSTQASMVFDPERGDVYIALKRDFSRIWKVSIVDETIEAFSGFARAEKARLDSSGILASDLESVGASQGIPWGYYVIGLAVVLVGGGACFVVIIRKRWQIAWQEIRAWLPVAGGFVVVGAIIGGVYALWVTGTQERDSAPTTPKVKMSSNSDGMAMVYVPEGEFLMGSTSDDSHAQDNEFPQHKIYLDAFWIDQTEVTNGMFAAFLNQVGNRSEGGVTWLDAEDKDVLIEQADGEWRAVSGYEDHPVMDVTWYGARAYCEWAGRRLPTEAEWEKAARGTEGLIFPWGNEPNSSLANIDTETRVDDFTVTNCPSGCDEYEFTAPVGTYPSGASPSGALDMAGNVFEWVADWYDQDVYAASPAENPQGPSSGSARIIRGGSWECTPDDVRTALRIGAEPDATWFGTGFRCARTP